MRWVSSGRAQQRRSFKRVLFFQKEREREKEKFEFFHFCKKMRQKEKKERLSVPGFF